MSKRSGISVAVGGGSRLHAVVEGAQAGPWVVLIHSLGTDHSIWDAQVRTFGRKFRLLRYDMRGHGRSDAPAGPYDIGLLTSDLFALIAHFGIDRAHIVGVSLGALTALEAALRKRPEIASIAVCNSRADMNPEFEAGIDGRNKLVRAEGMGAIADAMTERWLAARTIATRPRIAGSIRRIVSATPVEGFVACAEAVRTTGLTGRIAAIDTPAIFVASDQDGGLPVEVMRAMQLKVAGSAFAVIPGAAHLSNLDQPEIFNAILQRHFEAVAA
jgi:3-oxoadipate enol-lactonase